MAYGNVRARPFVSSRVVVSNYFVRNQLADISQSWAVFADYYLGLFGSGSVNLFRLFPLFASLFFFFLYIFRFLLCFSVKRVAALRKVVARLARNSLAFKIVSRVALLV